MSNFDSDTVYIDISANVFDSDPLIADTVEIPMYNNLPECPDCEASLTLTSQYYELPTGDNNEIRTTLVTATVIDTTENPVPANTLVEFESFREDEDGNFVPNGSIEPFKFTDENLPVLIWLIVSAIDKVRTATLLECPAVVGALDAIALTLALMNPSKSIWTEFINFIFFKETEAWDAIVSKK